MCKIAGLSHTNFRAGAPYYGIAPSRLTEIFSGRLRVTDRVPDEQRENVDREPSGRESQGVDSYSYAPSESSAADQRRDAFARLFAKNDRWLFGYLVTLLGNPAHAEEVFQEVCVVVWRSYDQFELGTDFVKWASVIAHNQVRKFRRSARRTGFHLSDETCERLAIDAVRRADLFDFRRDALRKCLQKLPGGDRQLVERCYGESDAHESFKSESFKSVAAEIGRPVNSVYKALNRIRRSLHECIDRTLAAEGLL